MNKEALDFTFDERVADQYDAQRAHPPEVSGQVGRAIAELVGSGKHILELGVGTGRIALPVTAAGCHVTGIDISADMLAQVQCADPEQQARLTLVQGDLRDTLPFPDASFDAVTAVHVLHLIDEWERLLDDTSRVLRPHAHFVMGRDWIAPESMSGPLQHELRRTVMELAEGQLKPPAGWGQIAAKLEQCGFLPVLVGDDEVIAAEWTVQVTPAAFIEAVRQRTNPESWILSDQMIGPVCERLEAAADKDWPGRDTPRPVRRRFLLTVFGRSDEPAAF